MAITIITNPSHGSVTIDGNDVVYTPDSGYEGPDTFTYHYDDGTISENRNVCLEVLAVEQVVTQKAWRGINASCVVSNGYLTGNKSFANLEEYNVATGVATGVVKVNVAGNPDYIAPVFDPIECMPLTGWRGQESTSYCVTSGSGATGMKAFAIIEEYYMFNNQLSGNTRVNDPMDPNYVPPVQDLTKCPIGTLFTATRSMQFFRSTCTPPAVPQPIVFTKTYTSPISQADANSLANNDPNFTSDGQAYANAHGSCVVAVNNYVQASAFFRSSACQTTGQYEVSIFATQSDIERLSTDVTESATNTGIYFFKDVNGTIKVDSGWYMGLDNDKSFYADNMGQITRYQNCPVQPPAVALAVEMDVDNNMQVIALLSTPYNQTFRIVGRIDFNPLNATPDGMNFDITMPQGDIQATDPNFSMLRDPSKTYYWQNAATIPAGFLINKQEPI